MIIVTLQTRFACIQLRQALSETDYGIGEKYNVRYDEKKGAGVTGPLVGGMQGGHH